MRSRGSVLIAVIWMMATLGVFTVALTGRVSQELLLGRWMKERVSRRILANAGVERALYEFQRDVFLNYDAFNEPWASNDTAFKEVPMGSGTFSVICREDDNPQSEGYANLRYGACDEAGLININHADEQILKNLYLILEKNDETKALQFAQAVLDWRDQDDTAMPAGAEKNHYKSLRHPYPPRNADFDSIEEIQMVRGVHAGFFRKMRPHITVHTDGKVNFNTASYTVLRILGLEADLAEKVIGFRRGNDEAAGTEDDGIFLDVSAISSSLSQGITFTSEEFAQIQDLIAKDQLSVKTDTFRIRAIGRFIDSDPHEYDGILCVIKRDGTILYWWEGLV